MDAWGSKSTPGNELIEMAAANLIRNALRVEANADEQAVRLQRHSLRKELVTDVVGAASAYSLSAGLDAYAFEDLAGSGISIINGLQYALTEPESFDWNESSPHAHNWNFWRHVDDPVSLIKKRQFPYMNRENIESEAYAYLDLPYRVASLERLLVDLLIALELFAFWKEMLEKPPRGFAWATRSPLMQKHALRSYFGGQFWSAIVFLGLTWLSGTIGRDAFGDTFAYWAMFVFVSLFALGFVLSTVVLPFVWRDQRQARKRARRLMQLTVQTYHEMHGDGQMSTRRLREAASHAADAGVVWPKPLFLMLDDNERRVGRI